MSFSGSAMSPWRKGSLHGSLLPKSPFFQWELQIQFKSTYFPCSFLSSQSKIAPISWHSCISQRQVSAQEKIPTAQLMYLHSLTLLNKILTMLHFHFCKKRYSLSQKTYINVYIQISTTYIHTYKQSLKSHRKKVS